jgi:hypothetical protein
VRHTLLVPIQRWRCPAALQVKAVVVAAAGVALAGVFFPPWFGVPVMVLLGVWGLGLAARPAEVVLDPDAGALVFRVGLLARRVRLANVTAVQADGAKVSIARSGGGEISVHAWRKSPLDRWLRIPVVAGEVAHAISRAAAAAQVATAQAASARRDAGTAARARDLPAPGAGDLPAPGAGDLPAPGAGDLPAPGAGDLPAPGAGDLPAPGAGDLPAAGAGDLPAAAARPGRRPFLSRQPLAVTLLGCTGVLALAAAFLVRVSWPDPVLTALGAILALALGVSGVCYVLFALWLLATGRAARRAAHTSPRAVPGGAKVADR